MPLLRLGSRGPDVAELQRLLTAAGFATKDDGVFGILTEAAVRSYQGEFGLIQDGIAGPKTLAMLRAEMPDTDPAIVLPIWGVDVSEYNPVVPWAALKAAGCSFAIPRGMTGADKKGIMREDRYARQHMAQARAAGILCPGFYGWMSEMRSGVMQGAFFASLGLPGFLSLDYEPGPGKQRFNDPARMRAEGTAFIQAIESAGRKCPVYTAPYAGPFPPSWATRPLWLARPGHAGWPDAPLPWGEAVAWQSGLVMGLDRNEIRGGLPALKAMSEP